MQIRFHPFNIKDLFVYCAEEIHGVCYQNKEETEIRDIMSCRPNKMNFAHVFYEPTILEKNSTFQLASSNGASDETSMLRITNDFCKMQSLLLFTL